MQELRYKAAKLVSTKLTLAARVDACHESTDGRIGRQLRDEIEKKLDKLQVRLHLMLLHIRHKLLINKLLSEGKTNEGSCYQVYI